EPPAALGAGNPRLRVAGQAVRSRHGGGGARVMAGPKHVSSTSFKKGQSGNPGGRSPRVGPNGETITQLCRAKTKELVDRAVEIALDKGAEHKDALTAIFGLLDRGWGKPTESVELDANVTGSGLPVIQIVRAAEAPPSEG